MPSLRQDPFSHQWVIITDYGEYKPRPLQPKEPQIQRGWLCPFCPGNESKTPSEVYAVRPAGSAPNAQGWSLRVVPSKFPMLSFDEPFKSSGKDLFNSMAPHGAHEVVLETENHDFPLIRFSRDKLVEVLRAFQQRILAIYEDSRIGYVQIHRNEGALAGAKLEHPHSTILGLPVVPDGILRQLEIAHEHHRRHKRCLTCEVIDNELRAEERVVYSNDEFVCIAPFASRVPYELAILPTDHIHRFEDLDEARLGELADAMKHCFWALHETLDSPALNYLIRTSPRVANHLKTPLEKIDHWRVEILPQTHAQAGLTWGTGLYSNPQPPEAAAERLRRLLVASPEPPHPLAH